MIRIIDKESVVEWKRTGSLKKRFKVPQTAISAVGVRWGVSNILTNRGRIRSAGTVSENGSVQTIRRNLEIMKRSMKTNGI